MEINNEIEPKLKDWQQAKDDAERTIKALKMQLCLANSAYKIAADEVDRIEKETTN